MVGGAKGKDMGEIYHLNLPVSVQHALITQHQVLGHHKGEISGLQPSVIMYV